MVSKPANINSLFVLFIDQFVHISRNHCNIVDWTICPAFPYVLQRIYLHLIFPHNSYEYDKHAKPLATILKYSLQLSLGKRHYFVQSSTQRKGHANPYVLIFGLFFCSVRFIHNLVHSLSIWSACDLFLFRQ